MISKIVHTAHCTVVQGGGRVIERKIVGERGEGRGGEVFQTSDRMETFNL